MGGISTPTPEGRRRYGNATLVGRANYSQRALIKRDLYAEVSARIVAELEAGTAPWIKPWSATAGANTPCNAVANRPYSGCNVVLLWMTRTAGPIRDIQVLCSMNRGGAGARSLNIELQAALNPAGASSGLVGGLLPATR